MSSQLPDTLHAQMRPEGRLKLIKSAVSQHSQLGWAMTTIKGFPQVPPELRAGQGVGKCFGKSPLLCWYHGILSTKEQIIHTVSNTTEKLITKDVDRVEKVQKNAMKMIKELENMPYEERLKEPSLLGEERAWEDLIKVLLYIQGG
ncbi:hypothetical protein TURU_150039 [Turdus rufiventris]|nr:hypothetical protein TURU_150039 [Turdus rufiventris]